MSSFVWGSNRLKGSVINSAIKNDLHSSVEKLSNECDLFFIL
jgi:hypothetical protein